MLLQKSRQQSNLVLKGSVETVFALKLISIFGFSL